MTDTDTTKTADDSTDTDESTVDDLMDSGADDAESDDGAKAAAESDDSGNDSDDADDDEPEPMAPPVDQSPALRNDGALNLGLCHFGGIEEPASILATRSDGTGWIAVCEKHTKDAEEQGFVIEESSAANKDEGKVDGKSADSEDDD